MTQQNLNLDPLSDHNDVQEDVSEAPSKQVLYIIDKDKRSLSSRLFIPVTILAVLVGTLHFSVVMYSASTNQPSPNISVSK